MGVTAAQLTARAFRKLERVFRGAVGSFLQEHGIVGEEVRR